MASKNWWMWKKTKRKKSKKTHSNSQVKLGHKSSLNERLEYYRGVFYAESSKPSHKQYASGYVQTLENGPRRDLNERPYFEQKGTRDALNDIKFSKNIKF